MISSCKIAPRVGFEIPPEVSSLVPPTVRVFFKLTSSFFRNFARNYVEDLTKSSSVILPRVPSDIPLDVLFGIPSLIPLHISSVIPHEVFVWNFSKKFFRNSFCGFPLMSFSTPRSTFANSFHIFSKNLSRHLFRNSTRSSLQHCFKKSFRYSFRTSFHLILGKSSKIPSRISVGFLEAF